MQILENVPTKGIDKVDINDKSLAVTFNLKIMSNLGKVPGLSDSELGEVPGLSDSELGEHKGRLDVAREILELLNNGAGKRDLEKVAAGIAREAIKAIEGASKHFC